MIRRASLDDLPWLMGLAEQAYPPEIYDRDAATAWTRSLLTSPACLFLRGERAAMVAIVKSFPYAPTVKAGYFLPVASLGSSGRELVKMTAMVLDWAKGEGAKDFYFAAVNGVDFGPLAKRFGGVPSSPSYVVSLRDV